MFRGGFGIRGTGSKDTNSPPSCIGASPSLQNNSRSSCPARLFIISVESIAETIAGHTMAACTEDALVPATHLASAAPPTDSRLITIHRAHHLLAPDEADPRCST